MSSCKKWEPELRAYKELRLLSFPKKGTINAAINLLRSDDLREMPFDLATSHAIIVPAEAVEYFKAAGLAFTVTDVPEVIEGDARWSSDPEMIHFEPRTPDWSRDPEPF